MALSPNNGAVMADSKTTPDNKKPSAKDAASVSLRKSGWLIFALAFFAMALLYHPQTGWNVNTRLALVYAVVMEGTFAIDSFHDHGFFATMDKAFYEDHYYSDKFFGVSLLGLPILLLINLCLGHIKVTVATFLMKAFAVALPGAISVVLFWLTLARTGTPPKRAVLITCFAFFGTMWFGYGTVFYPYVPGLACVLGALWVTLFPRAGRLTYLNCLGVGILLGYALLCDPIFGLVVGGVGMIWLMRLLDQTGLYGQRAFAEMTGERTTTKHGVVFAGAFWVGVLIPLSLFFAYSYSIFGTVTIPYAYEVSDRFREGMEQGLMGVTAPKPAALWFITAHPFRGIFFWSPVLITGLVGCVVGLGGYGKRLMLGYLGLWCAVAYLLFNAGYYMWWGGWGMGPRLMIPMIPFVMLGAGELAREGRLSAWQRRPKLGKCWWWTVIVAGAVSIVATLPLSLSDPQIPQGNEDIVLSTASIGTELAVPQFTYHRMFWSGRITVWTWERLDNVHIKTGSVPSNVLSIIVGLGIIAVLLYFAWKYAPAKIPGIHRVDYPFHTVDGTAAPPPPVPK